MSDDLTAELIPTIVLDPGANTDVVFDGLRQIIWRLAPDGAIERFNAFWTEYTGLPRIVDGLAWVDVFHPEDRQRLVDARTAGVASGDTYEVEARLRRVDGSFRRHLCRVTPLRYGGELTGWVGTAIDVEDVRAAEDAAHEAQHRKQQILESISEGYYALDRAFRLVEVNSACERMTGKTRSELIGENLWTAFPDAPPLETYTRVPLHGTITEERYSAAANRWVHITLYRSEHGYEAYFRDISERIAGEQALRESEARLKAVLDAVPVGIVLAEAPSGRITGGNARVETIFGHSILPTPDIESHREWRSSHADGRPVEADEYPLVRVLKGEPGFPSLEVLYHRGDGRDAWVRLVAAPITDASGLRGGVVACLDIDQEKRAEEQLRRARDRAESYLQVAQVVLLVLDERGYVQTINQHGAELLGYAVDELVGQDWFALAISPEHQPEMRSAFAELIGGNVDLLGTYVNPVMRRDGSERLVAWRNTLLRDADGRIVGTLSSGDDVTEERAAQERERLLAQEIDHRAKNLLAVVQSVVQLTRAEDLAEFKAAVTGRIQSLARTHGLLAAARWEGADLAQIVTDELAPFTAADRTRAEIAGPALKLTPNAAQALALVLHELATNGAKYGALSTAAGRVSVTWTRSPSNLDIRWVETGGPATATPTRQGFGSIVLRSSVERQLGGSVGLDWRPEGLVCDISLRAGETILARGPSSPKTPVKSIERDPTRAARQLRVLVVEDEALIAAQIENAVTTAGHAVAAVTARIADAFEAIYRCDPDVAILDINVAGERSFPVAEVLRTRGVPFAFCSGYDSSISLPGTLGGAPMLTKPFDPAELARAIETLSSQVADRSA